MSSPHRTRWDQSARASGPVARWWPVASVLVVAVPVVAAVARTAGTRWYPTIDWAIEVLRVGDVGTSHTPLLGAPSRFGWYHPGPAQLWWAAPFYRIGGPNGFLVATAVSNLVALVMAVAVAWRRGGAALGCLVTLAVVVVLHALGPSFLVDPWNPWVAFLPYLAFLLLMWSAGCGSTRSLAVGSVVGSFCVMAHVGYLPVVGIPFGLAVALLIGGRVRSRRPPTAAAVPGGRHAAADPWLRRHWVALVAVGLLVLLWAPPLVQQAGPDGNVSAIVDHLGDPTESSLGWGTGLRVTARQLSLDGPWVSGAETSALGLLATAPVWPSALAVVLALLLGLTCLAAGRREAGYLALFAVAASVAALAATARLSGIPAGYLVRWSWGVALLLWTSIFFCAWRIGQWRWPALSGRPGRPAWVFGGAAVLLAAAVLAGVTATDRATVPLPENSRALAALVGPAAEAVDVDRPITVEAVDPASLGGLGPGMAVHLLREGYPVRLGPSTARWWGSWRVRRFTRSTQVLSVVSTAEAPRWEAKHPNRQIIARYEPLTTEERARALRLESRVRAAIGPDTWLLDPGGPPGSLVVGDRVRRDALISEGASRTDVEQLRTFQAAGVGQVLFYCPRNC